MKSSLKVKNGASIKVRRATVIVPGRNKTSLLEVCEGHKRDWARSGNIKEIMLVVSSFLVLLSSIEKHVNGLDRHG